MSRRNPGSRSRQAGLVDNCFSCASMLVIGGLAVALYMSGGKLDELPTWTKVGGPIAAVLVLAGAWFVDGRGGVATQGETPPQDPPPPGAD